MCGSVILGIVPHFRRRHRSLSAEHETAPRPPGAAQTISGTDQAQKAASEVAREAMTFGAAYALRGGAAAAPTGHAELFCAGREPRFDAT